MICKSRMGLQAMNKDLLIHICCIGPIPVTIEMKNRKNDLDWDMLSTYGQDDSHQSVLLQEKRLLNWSWESFSPLSSRMPVDLETLPMMLKCVKRKSGSYHIGHPPILLHLSELKAVRFSYAFINEGLSCLSILMESLVPKTFTRVLVMSLAL